jgi:hypothetical protein
MKKAILFITVPVLVCFLLLSLKTKSVQGSQVCRCGAFQFTLNDTLPSTDMGLSNQTSANCYAWNEFVALNWPANTNLSFGAPGDLSPLIWQGYMTTGQIFLPGGIRPAPWGSLTVLPAGVDRKKFMSRNYLLLRESQKIPRGFRSSEAVLNSGPSWLGAQNGTNIWYEVVVNQSEYNYIVRKGFYNARTQYDSCSTGTQILLPSIGDGAIEIKSAWMEVPDTTNPKWNRYKLSLAYVQGSGGRYRETVVALVGLHILRKTATQPTFVWATFEQVDNLPDPASGSLAPYNLNNPNCQPNTVTVKTQSGKDTTVTVSCASNTQPPYYLVNGNSPVPIQVSRLTSLHTSSVDSANAQVVRGITAAYPNSVWQYYRMVNVIWSTSPVQDNNQNKTDSMIIRAMQPLSPVANVTLETYNQNTSCAQTCHRFASIATVPGITGPNYLSDFSFVFGLAKASPQLKSVR